MNAMHTLDTAVFATADVVLKGTLVLLGVGVVHLLLWRSAAALLHRLWLQALMALLVIPVLSVCLPSWRVLPAASAPQSGDQMGRVFASTPPSATTTIRFAPRPGPDDATPLPRHPENVMAQAPTPHGARTLSLSWSRVALLVWTTGCGLALLPVLLGALSLMVLERHCVELRCGAWEQLMRAVAGELGLRRRVVLLQTDRRSVPMTWGLWKPRILIPAQASQWPEHHRRALLLHELAHVKRADCLTDVLGRLTCAAYWFHPMAWFALARMRELRERACDDAALSAGSDGVKYAELLMQLVSARPAYRLTGAQITMAHSTNLKHRLRAVLDESRCRYPLSRARSFLTAVVLLSAVIPLSMLKAAAPQPGAASSSQPAGQIRGDVTEVDGTAVVGAAVELLSVRYVKNSVTVAGVDTLARTRSGDRGAFELPMPPDAPELRSLFVRATAPGRAYGYAMLRHRDGHAIFFDASRHEEMDHPSLILPPEAHLSGVVMDEQGRPVAGATVAHRAEDVATTDAQGRFKFDKVSPSRYGIFWDFNHLEVRHPDYVKTQVRLDDVVAGKDTFVRIPVEHGVLLRGMLSDADTAKPLSGFLVTAESETGQEARSVAYSGEDGRYEIRIPLGAVTVRPSVAIGFGAADTNYYPVVDLREVRTSAAADAPEANFTFRHGRSISGRIAGAGPLDLSGLYLEARPADAEPNWRNTNRHGMNFAPDGSFRIPQLRPGRYELLVSAVRNSQMKGELLNQPVVVPAAQDVAGVVLQLPPQVVTSLATDLRGVVRYADGRPSRDARVDLVLQEGSDPTQASPGGETHTLADGTFVFHGIDPTRKWTLWALDAAARQGASIAITQSGQLKQPIELALQMGASFTGTVKTPEGKGVSGYVVDICEEVRAGQYTIRRPRVRSVTDDQGRYVLSGFVPPPGAKGFLLEAAPDMLANRQRRISLTDEPYRNLDIRVGTTQSGFDFEVIDHPSSIQVTPKRAAPQRSEAK